MMATARIRAKSRMAEGAGLTLMLLLLAFGFYGSRGLWAPDEGRYVSIALTMLDMHDYMIPRLSEEIYLDKPPLSIWAIAAGIKLFGRNEYGARVFYALSYVLTTCLVYLLGESLLGKQQGIWGGVIYATMGLPFIASNIITPDTPLVLWTTMAAFCFWESVKPDARHVTLYKLLMCVAFGMGFLTKGPAAVVPSAGLIVFLVLQRRLWRYAKGTWLPLGILLFFIVGLGWYAYVAYTVPGSLGYFWDNQVVGRTVSNKYNRNPGLLGALTIYLPVLLLGTLPWSTLWIRWFWRKRSAILTSLWVGETRGRAARIFLATWALVPLLVFCIASSKLPLYILPSFPALALITATIWSSASLKRNRVQGLVRFSQQGLYCTTPSYAPDGACLVHPRRSVKNTEQSTPVPKPTGKLAERRSYTPSSGSLHQTPSATQPGAVRNEIGEKIGLVRSSHQGLCCTAASHTSDGTCLVHPRRSVHNTPSSGSLRQTPSATQSEAVRDEIGEKIGLAVLSPKLRILLGVWMGFLLVGRLAVSFFPTDKDMRALHVAMSQHLSVGHFEVVSVKDNVDGLTLYGVPLVEKVTITERQYPVFVPPEHLDSEILEMRDSGLVHLVISRGETRSEIVRATLADAGVTFEEISLPYGRKLFLCPRLSDLS